jgi:hypothetical protein
MKASRVERWAAGIWLVIVTFLILFAGGSGAGVRP